MALNYPMIKNYILFNLSIYNKRKLEKREEKEKIFSNDFIIKLNCGYVCPVIYSEKC